MPQAGADVIVNTDADNQYDAAGIPALVEPILAGRAQIVIGERPIMNIREFSLVKKLLQRLGSAVVKMASNTSVPDAPSGFRAMHAEAALRLCVFSDYTYTLETIIRRDGRISRSRPCRSPSMPRRGHRASSDRLRPMYAGLC